MSLPRSGSTIHTLARPPHPARLPFILQRSRVFGMDVFNFHVVRIINSFLSGRFQPRVSCYLRHLPVHTWKLPVHSEYRPTRSQKVFPLGVPRFLKLSTSRLFLSLKCPLLCWFLLNCEQDHFACRFHTDQCWDEGILFFLKYASWKWPLC